MKSKVGFLSSLISKYGSVTVSLATLILSIAFISWFSIRQINWMQSQFNLLQEDNHTEMVEIIQRTVDDAVKDALNDRDREHNEQSLARLEMSPRINTEIKRYLLEIDCDHISVCEYHNGYQNITTSLPFCRYSITYEASRSGYRHIASDFQSMPVSPILTMCELNTVTHFKTDEVKELDDYIYYYMTHDHVKEIYLCPIMHEGRPCGVLICANFTNRNSNVEKIKQLSKDIAVALYNAQ